MLPPPPARPPQLTGANALPVNPRSAAPENAQQQPNQQENVHQVENDYPAGRNVYKEHEAAYVVFVSELTDRQSINRRMREINAVMPAVPRYMHWSDQQITWSQADHPKVMPNPGGYALVLDPTLVGPQIPV